MAVYKISVRSLVEFILRSGSIESGVAGGVRANLRALEGTRLHGKMEHLSEKQNPSYQREVSFLKVIPVEEADGTPLAVLEIEGRADGVYTEDGLYTIDEIKSVDEELDDVAEGTYPLHWAQAECYAFLLRERLIKEHEEDPERPAAPDIVRVRLTYVETESETFKYLYHTYTAQELTAFFDEVTSRYLAWVRFHARWARLRDETLRHLSFPYDTYRPGQQEMSDEVSEAIRRKELLFLQAPTGIGKTLSVLYPSLTAIGQGQIDRIFYLTARHTAGQAAQDTVRLLCEKSGLRLKTVRITAKDKICFLDKRECSPKICPCADGHFDRVNDAVLASLEAEDFFDAGKICQLAKKYRVCPFEFSLDLCDWADLIICDYNYAFDPNASLKRFFADTPQRAVLLVDEAHNLVDRAREMYTARLDKKAVLQIRRLTAPKTPLYRSLTALNKVFGQAGNEVTIMAEDEGLYEMPPEGYLRRVDEMDPQLITRFLTQLMSTAEDLGAYLEASRREVSLVPDEQTQAIWDFYFDVLFFLRLCGRTDEGFSKFFRKTSSNVSAYLFCVDPSGQLRQIYRRVLSVIFFSATMEPVWYYERLLAGTDKVPSRSLPSPFPRENRLIALTPLAMNYRSRERNLPALVRLIHSVYTARDGHYMVYFPSFGYLNKASEAYRRAFPDDELLIQSSSMTESAREAFLSRLKNDPRRVLGMGVLGGVFAESVDLTGESLVGAIVVSCGLPQVSFERGVIKAHLDGAGDDQLTGKGFAYAYTYPGLCRVLQAAGRVIRTPSDKGVIFLVDERFVSDQYRELFPPDWDDALVLDIPSVPRALEAFWQGAGQAGEDQDHDQSPAKEP